MAFWERWVKVVLGYYTYDILVFFVEFYFNVMIKLNLAHIEILILNFKSNKSIKF